MEIFFLELDGIGGYTRGKVESGHEHVEYPSGNVESAHILVESPFESVESAHEHVEL
ncbi:MAG: hypothetical protein Q8935_25060 [Bacillota bacterium]|nr:hypothetical protein [Bacillota bacterium]MDP4157354.1 hypothetical protein [Bacillota bacterium]